MTSAAFNLENLSNFNPCVLTILVIGTEENLRNYIYSQRHFGIEVNAWSKIIPVPSCPGKHMSLLNRTIVPNQAQLKN
ncbi:hypothetical protein A6770_15205 [Nostoc minutum NIES-26]|uniref:Uncharacterized protein n=1 Tax=Nostoc minutum NIES-26 TaxID=1844469 RepID=A0A367RLT2_9NOSO|nr:hypothetical protein A6770_15205 [Nostoc minutum NIES-26]